MKFQEIKEWVTFGIAMLGATLGVLNAWWAFSRQRVRLKVEPSVCYDFGSGIVSVSTAVKLKAPERPFAIRIDVINLSEFEISLDEVGLALPNRDRFYTPFIDLYGRGAAKLPVRIKPREKASFAIAIDSIPQRSKKVKLAVPYALTECGHRKTGMSQSYRQLIAGLGPKGK